MTDEPTLVQRIAKQIIAEHDIVPPGVIHRMLLMRVGRELAGLESRMRTWYDGQMGFSQGRLALDLKPHLSDEPVELMVWFCPDCGDRPGASPPEGGRVWPPVCLKHDESVQMEPIAINARKLPDAFCHLDSALDDFTMKRLVTKVLPIQLRSTGVATVRLIDAGGFVENAEVMLRFAAEQERIDYHAGEVQVAGIDENGVGLIEVGLVRFTANAAAPAL